MGRKPKTAAEWMCELMCPDSARETIVEMAQYMIDYKCSIRKLAEEFNIPKSTVHKYFTHELQYIDHDLYDQCCNIMKKHKKRERDERGRFI